MATVHNFKGMVIKINKADFERIIEALVIANVEETNARKKDMFNLTRKKINRQNEVFRKKDSKRVRGV